LGINTLEKQRALILIGAPGVGKTVTSKMLVLYFADKGYRVRYTTNGNISDIKRTLSVDKECKELILLDDCLGQCYFKLNDTQENELLSLIKFVKLYPNKAIILNSRITIFNEAQDRSHDLFSYVQNRNIKMRIIDMDLLSPLEKARIFYNHLKRNHIPDEYFINIVRERNYRKIVMHPNYNPRIIEYVTSQMQYQNVQPENYFNFILLNLNNPKDVWKNEFDRRLSFVDRIFMNTLFSLTETTIPYEILKECFNCRLSQEVGIDYTLNNFDMVITRLNKSLIKIIDEKGKMTIGVLNPSINDYFISQSGFQAGCY